jgi:two-component system sensor histidine kinase and response regulator WspE
MGLAGESLVQSRWFEPFSKSLLSLKRRTPRSTICSNPCRRSPNTRPKPRPPWPPRGRSCRKRGAWYRRAAEQGRCLRHSIRRTFRSPLSRSRPAACVPFGDGVGDFPRLVRDVARQLGKQVRLEIIGASTEVDREILDRLEAPLNHAILNSLDHGIELPEDRVAAGKPRRRQRSASKRATAPASSCSPCPTTAAALISTRCAPLWSTRDSPLPDGRQFFRIRAAAIPVSSRFLHRPRHHRHLRPGRRPRRRAGHGQIGRRRRQSISSRLGQGLSIQLELPLTLSVLRMVVAEIGGEPFAFPMTRIAGVVKVNRAELSTLEGQQYFLWMASEIGAVSALEVLDIPGQPDWGEEISMVLLAIAPIATGRRRPLRRRIRHGRAAARSAPWKNSLDQRGGARWTMARRSSSSTSRT